MKTQIFFKTTSSITNVVLLALLMTSCSSDDGVSIVPEPTNTIYDFVEGDFNYSEFVEAVDLIGFEAQLRDMSMDYTVLIPSNEAFNDFYADNLFESNEAKIEALNIILRQHIITNEMVLYNDAENGIGTQNMNGEDVYFYLEGVIMVIDVYETLATYATETDITTDNGVIHVVADIITAE